LYILKSMKTNKKQIVLLLILTSLFSCKKNENTQKVEVPKVKDISENLNISILLDLSDRISPTKYPNPTMDYYLRDVGYINSISESFSGHVKNKKVRRVDDKIQIFFDPAPLNPEINKISKELKIAVNKNNVSKEMIKSTKTTYANSPLKIYKLAIKDNNYVGSDTWKFFKNKVNDYCIENNYRNILVILTDGYIYYRDSKIKEVNQSSYLTPEVIRSYGLNKSNWSKIIIDKKIGFIPANVDLSNLEILVLGINPDPKNPYEEEVIKAYWTHWFEAMKVKRFEIKNADIPSNMDIIIKNFISKK
jgi:hypothetical protein